MKAEWLTFSFENSFSFLVLFNFEFSILDGCSKKSILWINFIETFLGSFDSMHQSISSNLFWFFLGHWWCRVLFTWVDFFISFSTINNSDCDTSSIALATRAGVSVRPKIGNRKKNQRKHGKYPKKLRKQLVTHEKKYEEMGETCRKLPLVGFLSHLVTSFQAALYIGGLTCE